MVVTFCVFVIMNLAYSFNKLFLKNSSTLFAQALLTEVISSITSLLSNLAVFSFPSAHFLRSRPPGFSQVHVFQSCALIQMAVWWAEHCCSRFSSPLSCSVRASDNNNQLLPTTEKVPPTFHRCWPLTAGYLVVTFNCSLFRCQFIVCQCLRKLLGPRRVELLIRKDVKRDRGKKRELLRQLIAEWRLPCCCSPFPLLFNVKNKQ